MTGRVRENVACGCGYRGPAVEVAGRPGCPICRTPAEPSPASTVPPTGVVRGPATAASGQPPKVRISCPRGHVHKAGAHLFGRQVVCPECNEMFVLRREDSLEHRREQEQARLAEEERFAKRWLSRSIWAAALIVTALAALIAFSFASRKPAPPPSDQPSGADPAARSD